MSNPKVLVCPTCGAKLNISGNEAQVQCDYCGNAVVVPEELRAKKPETIRIEMPEPQVIIMQQPAIERQVYRPAGTGTSCVSSVVGVISLLILIGAIAIGVISNTNPKLFDSLTQSFTDVTQNVTGPSFAKLTATFGGEGTGPGLFQDVRHVAVDSAGNIYVSDFNTLRIQRFDANGKFLNFWTLEDPQGAIKNKYGPSALAADRAGNVYAIWVNVIFKYEGATGKLLGRFTGEVVDSTLKRTDDFQDITVLADGTLLALTNGISREDLVRLDANGKVTKRIQKPISSQTGETTFAHNLHVAADGLNNIFVLYTFGSEGSVYRFTPDGKYVNKFGGKGDKPGQLYFPAGLAVDGKSRVYVIDNKGIQVFDADGAYIDIVVRDSYNYSGHDMAINDNNEIYVAGGKNQIYKFVPAAKDGK